MKLKYPKSYQDITDKADGNLRYLLDNLAKINRLDQFVKANIAHNVQKHCRVINYRNNKIIIATSSSVWATRLKFELPSLLSQLRAEGFSGLSSIEVIVSKHAIEELPSQPSR